MQRVLESYFVTLKEFEIEVPEGRVNYLREE